MKRFTILLQRIKQMNEKTMSITMCANFNSLDLNLLLPDGTYTTVYFD